MPTDAEKRAIIKYQAKFDDIKVRVPKGDRERYKRIAEKSGRKSLNALIVELLEEFSRKLDDKE